MSSPEPLTARLVAESARRELLAFERRIRGVPYERKGVLFWEMLFVYLCARSAAPRRILESGRARGQSTLLLALCFPELPIVSLEHDPASPDASVAAERLRPYPNVQLEFGDAMRLLPAIAREGDVVLIDGPKGFRALRLALSLLSGGRISMVFLHDMTAGTRERAFLERRLPATLYSDAADFAAVANTLDAAAADIPAALRWDAAARRPYGYGMACLPRLTGTSYRRARIAAAFSGFAARVRG
jgi:predicted O-methyltransferase YrrM